MRVIYFGSGEFAVPSLRWLANSPHDVAAVVTPPDRPAGRGKKLVPPAAADRAIEDELPLVRCADVNAPEFVERMRDRRADLGIVIDFGQKLLGPLRSAFGYGCVNIHGSLLPKYRGAAPVAWAILQGEKKTGVSVFRLVDRMDAGPILVQRETMIDPAETCGDLEARLARIGCDAIGAALRVLEGDPRTPGEPQDESQATRAPKLAKADGCLRFDVPAEQLALRCRAMWPWPGARCRYRAADGRSENLTVAVAAAIPTPASEPPGTMTPVLTVATAGGTLEIHSLKPAGKRLMSWQEFVNGRHVRPGDRLETID